MINKNKVMIGLGQHINGSMWDRCGDCPYYNPDDSGIHCRDALLEDLHELIGDLEPRVMTLEEVADWHKKPALEREPIYIEYRPNSGLGISQWTIDYFGFNPNYYPNKEFGLYGRWIRCWTSCPTEEQREVTPWLD